MFQKKIFPMLVLIVLMLAFILAPAYPVLASPAAVTFTVNSPLDQPDDLTIPGTCHTAANTCTLRAAIMQANRTSGSGATIIVPAGVYNLTIPAAGSDGEENGDLNLTTPASGTPSITISGAGAATTILDANQLDRGISIAANRTASISDMTIRNGYRTTDKGGGISNAGNLTATNLLILSNHDLYGGGINNQNNLTLVKSSIGQNTTVFDGAGVYSQGNLIVVDSTITGNLAGGWGGGIFIQGNLTLRNSTISANQAVNGGGIYSSGSMIVINTTISQNSASVYGGGIFNSQFSANIYNTTIVFNSAETDTSSGGQAGGVYNANSSGATFNLRNSLVAGNNVANSPIYDDCTGALTSYGRNLFWMVTGCTVTNAPGGSWTTLNSLSSLGPLQNNGGTTFTHALLPGSNAIDGADPVSGCVDNASIVLTTDQRGEARSVGVRCDIGAFEYNPAPKTAHIFVYLPSVLH